MGIEKCFHNLVKDDNFVREFKDYVKNLYKHGQVPQGFPSSWANANRQINRIIAFSRQTGSQARSGAKAFGEGGWLSIALNEFLDKTFNDEAIKCLRNMNVEGDKPVGFFKGVAPPDEFFPPDDFRGRFEFDWESIKAYCGHFLATVPTGLVLRCGVEIYVLPSMFI